MGDFVGRCRVGAVDITLAGAGAAEAFTWKDPDTLDGTPAQVELARAPRVFFPVQRVRGGSGTSVTVSVTKNGGTITPHVATDTSTYRIWGFVDP